MKVAHLFKIAITALVAHRTRTLLTVLGIVIGVSAIMGIVSIGKGAEGVIMGELSGMGTDMLVIRPGKEPKGLSDITDTIFGDSLKNSDVKALLKKTNVPGLKKIAPGVIVSANVSYGKETYRPTILGWDPSFMGDIFNIYPQRGAFFTEEDIRNRESVAVIGSKVAEELFGTSDPIGKKIRIKERKFRIVALLPPRGQVAFFNIDETVIIPPTTAQRYLLGIDYYNEILVMAESPEVVERTVRDIEATLRETHGITDPKDDDFFVVTPSGMIKQVGSILDMLTVFLSSVVAIALVVGGIGVMNIMLVSVTERTREIGLRKALGATTKDILMQFLMEAIILTVFGGLVGIIIGSLFSLAVSVLMTQGFGLSWPFVFPVFASALGLFVSLIVGLIFGIYPARQASMKSPIEALRYE